MIKKIAIGLKILFTVCFLYADSTDSKAIFDAFKDISITAILPDKQSDLCAVKVEPGKYSLVLENFEKQSAVYLTVTYLDEKGDETFYFTLGGLESKPGIDESFFELNKNAKDTILLPSM